jgi:hypothetical protein
MEKDFVIKDVLGFGWRVMKSHIGFFIKVILLYAGVFFIMSLLQSFLGETKPQATHGIVFFCFWLLEQVAGIILAIGFIKIGLSFCDQVTPKVGTLFDGFDCFWRYLGVHILYVLIVFCGMLLLIIPGIIWAVKFQYGYYFVIDRHLGPIEALKASSRTTQGVKMKLFGFGLLCGLINIAGALCLLVGLFATVPTMLVAMALTYRHLMMQTPELAEFGIQSSVPQAASVPVNDEPPQNQFPPTDPGEEIN